VAAFLPKLNGVALAIAVHMDWSKLSDLFTVVNRVQVFTLV